MIRFVSFGGTVHLVSPLGGREHTLCGVAFDAADSERDESLRWIPLLEKPVDCGQCVEVIRACWGVRTSEGARR